MPDKHTIPKFNLVKKAEVAGEDSQESLSAQKSPSVNLKLAVREGEPQQPHPSKQSDNIEVKHMLDVAYAPDKERTRQSNRTRRIWKVNLTLGAIALSTCLIFAYAHVWQKWPLLETATWYLPFLVSLLVSLYACYKAVSMFNEERNYAMTVTGICIAGALTYWNALVLDVTAQPDIYAPNSILWEADSDTEKLLAYEINSCRGWGTTPGPYIQVNIENYKSTFRALPRDEWKQYFNLHLSEEDLSKTTTINIDEKMRLVSEQMLRKRVQVWNNFDAQYREPNYLFKLKRALVLPYVFAFKHL
ncbi:MAG: hypothetical protein ABF330_00350 [Lentimonas sp.]